MSAIALPDGSFDYRRVSKVLFGHGLNHFHASSLKLSNKATNIAHVYRNGFLQPLCVGGFHPQAVKQGKAWVAECKEGD